MQQPRACSGCGSDELGLARAHVVGHSLGGLVAARFAASAPERVSRLVLIAPAGIGMRRSLRSFAVPLARAGLTSDAAFARLLVADALRTGLPRLARTGRALLVDDRLRDELAAILAPTLLVWGHRDPLVPPSLAAEFLAALPDARLHVVARAGHVPMWNRPAEIAEAIHEHLAAGVPDPDG